MPTIRPATSADLDAIAAFLADSMRGGGADRYRRFFSYTWPTDKPNIGYLIEDGRVHGFVGAIYSDRVIGGRAHRVCNITSLAVRESHRKQTLQLVKHFLSDKTLTYTCFSGSPQTAEILRFFKFHELPGTRLIVSPLSGAALALSPPRPGIVDDPTEMERLLTEEELRISNDHRRYRCAQLVIEKGDRRCFVIAVRRGRDVRCFADVLHASDKALLMEALPWIHVSFAKQLHTALTGIDRRWVAAPPLISFEYTNFCPLHVRSAQLTPADIDGLYSELVPMYG